MEHTTIKEIAGKARVSTATVSRILNGKYRRHSKTVENVNRIVEELRHLRLQQTAPARECAGVIMFAYQDFLNSSYNATLTTAMMEALATENFDVQFIALTNQTLNIEYIKLMIQRYQLRGLLVPEFDMLYTISAELDKLPIPVIGIGDISAGFRYNVCSDSYMAGCDAVNYLWSNGHRKFGLLSMARTDLCQQKRIAGFKDTIRQLGGDPKQIWSREYRSTEDSVSGAVSELLNMGASAPSAILSTNSMMCQKLFAELSQANVRVPEDISLLSFEENGELEHLPVPISVLRQPTRDMGIQATGMLSKCVRSLTLKEREILNCSLIVRKSVRNIQVK